MWNHISYVKLFEWFQMLKFEFKGKRGRERVRDDCTWKTCEKIFAI